ncbi:MAG: SH3 domain-containing protein [Clostridia bacterium]|nr:SH3 domain-containing protein [Clostridia bacterium]
MTSCLKKLCTLTMVILLLLSCALPAMAAGSSGYYPFVNGIAKYNYCTAPEYYVCSTKPQGYTYLYSEASDINGKNLGKYDNGEKVKVIEYYGGSHGQYNYCYVITKDHKLGYIHDYALIPVISADTPLFLNGLVEYDYCTAPEYYVCSTKPQGFAYLYSEASDIKGENLGKYNNGQKVKVIEYYGGSHGKYNYCYVITQKNKLGYIHDYSLMPVDDPTTPLFVNGLVKFEYCTAPEYYINSTKPQGFTYLYSEASDIDGKNLGKYDNGEKVKVIKYYGGSHGKYNYCYVITEDHKLGYIHDYALTPVIAPGNPTATPLKITKQPANATAKVGSIVKTTVEAQGDGLTYTWYLKNPSATKFGKSSVTGKTYSWRMTRENSGRQVYCVITDAYGNSVSTKVVRLSAQ